MPQLIPLHDVVHLIQPFVNKGISEFTYNYVTLTWCLLMGL